MSSSNKIKSFILDNISRHQRDIILTTIQRFGISRQAILKHMHVLIDEKKIVAFGKTRDRYYELRPQVNLSKTLVIDNNLLPNQIINDHIISHLSSLPNNIKEIVQFSMAALITNILDHAKANTFYFKLYLTHNDFHIILSDNGIGLFGHIKSLLKLDNHQIAAIELAKGRVTTDPENHSGDELYTVIHLFDSVIIESSGKALSYDNQYDNWLINNSKQQRGTRIHLKINPLSKRTCHHTFEKIFNGETKVVRIPINLIKNKDNPLVNSRAQAKSILRNIDEFNLIEFDFNNIELIGPAFADELIRNTKKKNGIIDIQWINSNKTIDLMMSRALNRFS